MITFVYGAPGAGKTEYIFKTVDPERPTFILVPEQETVVTERLALEKLGAVAQLKVEVLNFTRLCNRVFRQYGGLSHKYISPSMRSLFMWKTLRELAPTLEEYSAAANDPSTISVMLSAVDELRSSCVTPDELEAAAEKLQSPELSAKLRDIAKISAWFNAFVSQSFNDKTEELSKLADLLKKHKFFAGCDVYIDSFTSFTALERSIIEKIFEQADNVTVTLACESPEEKLVCTESICETAKALIDIAKKFNKKHEKIFLTGNFRAKNEEIRGLASDIWKSDQNVEVPENERGNIRIFACPEPYEEADIVAATILNEVRRGLRYRDIAVVARDISLYDGIIDAALETAKIPYFMSKKSDLSASPAIAWLLYALRVITFGWRSEDVISYLRTGLCDVSSADADMFEEYVETWNIHGDGFKSGVFDMNPDGFQEQMSKRGEAILAAANLTRETIVPPLEDLIIKLKSADNAKEMCAVLFEFMSEAKLAEKLEELAKKELSLGSKRSAADLLATWNVIINLLDDIATAFDGDRLSVEELYQALILSVKNADLGAIPTGYDEVTLGSASLLRSGNVKCAILIGLNEGEFPAAISDRGIFTETDRKMLSDANISLSSDALTKASDELMFLRRAVTLPSDRLYLLYTNSYTDGSKKLPSMLINKITKRFNYIKPENSQNLPLEYKLTVPENAYRLIEDNPGTAVGDALRKELSERGFNTDKKYVSEPECTVDKATVDAVVGKELRLSQSKIDVFNSCQFKYYSNNVLGLRSDERAELQFNIFGTVVHAVLEKFLKKATSNRGISEDDADKIANEIIEEQLSLICTEKQRNSNRVKYIFGKIRNIALLFIRSVREELKDSSFKPKFFELKANGQPLEPVKMALDGGKTLVVNEIIDRVDVYHRDGRVYVKIVDYKTGSKKFNIDKIKDGLEIQLLLYLFSVCRSEKFAKAIECADGELPEPAAVNYISFDKELTAVSTVQDGNGDKMPPTQKITRSGLFIDEETVTSALGESKDGKEMKAVSKTRLDELEAEVEEFLRKISDSILNGDANAEPKKEGGKNPCSYCKMSPFCRNAIKSDY